MAKAGQKEEVAKTADAPKYGIKDLAKVMNLKEASVRVKLRKSNINKCGKAYAWNSKNELEEVASKLGPADKPAKKTAPKTPAKKAAAKKKTA